MSDKRSEIMKAAIGLVADKGFSSATIDAISKRANVAKGLFYYYFKRKDDVFVSAVTETIKNYFLFFDQMPASPNRQDRIFQYVNAHILYVEQNRESTLYFYKYFDEFAQDQQLSTPVHNFVSKCIILLQHLISVKADNNLSVEKTRMKLLGTLSLLNGVNRFFLHGVLSKDESKEILIEGIRKQVS